jgi:uncharacterized protein (TIGR03435 family)
MMPDICSSTSNAPQPIPSGIAYDVVSIRETKANQWIWRFTDDGYIGSAIPLASFIRTAFFPVSANQIDGLPSWANAMYSIQAKVGDEELNAYRNLSADDRKAMLRTILINQFHMKFHYVKHLEAVYALVPSKSGIKPLSSNPTQSAKSLLDDGIVLENGNRVLRASNYTMVQLARRVSWLDETNGRKVIDCTGLSGTYTFTLTWSSQDSPEATDERGNGPSIFTALKEQLGIELRSMRAPVDHLIIDHIEKPSTD